MTIMDGNSPTAGVIHSLHIKEQHGAPMQRVKSAEAVTMKGIKGDQAYGRKSRQVLLVDQSQIDQLGVRPGDLRENLTVEGLTLDGMPVGTRLKSDDVVLRIVEVCDPCSYLDTIRQGLKRESIGRRGMLAVIENGGRLEEGRPIEVLAFGADF